SIPRSQLSKRPPLSACMPTRTAPRVVRLHMVKSGPRSVGLSQSPKDVMARSTTHPAPMFQPPPSGAGHVLGEDRREPDGLGHALGVLEAILGLLRERREHHAVDVLRELGSPGARGLRRLLHDVD